MTTEIQEALLSNVYPLSDALLMPMRLYHKVMKIAGELDAGLPIGQELTVTMKPKVFASFVCTSEAAVLVKVRKRLWLLAHYVDATKRIDLSLIDAEALDMHESNWADGRLGKPAEAYEVLKHGIRAKFSRLAYEEEWTRIDADTLDTGHQGEPAGRGESVTQGTDTA